MRRWKPLRKYAYTNIRKIYHHKKWKFSDKKSDIFSYLCSKHRLWVPVRTASSNRLVSTHNLCFGQKYENNVYPCKPQFYYSKVGFKRGQNHIGMFSWWYVAFVLSLLFSFFVPLEGCFSWLRHLLEIFTYIFLFVRLLKNWVLVFETLLYSTYIEFMWFFSSVLFTAMSA